jgi:DNA-binding transcriptional MocR family regulator
MTGLPAHKYAHAAAIVRAQITNGTLKPGQPAPSGGALARLTGYSTLTCRKALRTLIRDGILTPGPSPAARPRVAVPDGPRPRDAARRLSRARAAARRASGLTQPALAALTGYSVTTIGHAETSRLWQSRQFWEKADLALAAGGELTRLYDAYHAETASPASPRQIGTQPPEAEAVPAALSRLTLHWSDGTVTTAYPPAAGLPH